MQSPPNGEHDALQKYFEKYPDFKCQVSTFGFGYALKSKMLLDIAMKGQGVFSFIPDAKIVGTCFVNAIANACSNLSQNCKIHIIPNNDELSIESASVLYESTNWGIVGNIGCLQYGQTRDILVRMKSKELNFHAIVEYESSIGESHKIGGPVNVISKNDSFVYAHNKLIVALQSVLELCESKKGSEANKLLKTLHGEITIYESKSGNVKDERVTRLLSDINGRMAKAISSVERFNR